MSDTRVAGVHFVDMSLVHPFLDVGQTADVEWRVGQNTVHPRQAIHGEKTVEDADDEEVQVIGTSLLQSATDI